MIITMMEESTTCGRTSHTISSFVMHLHNERRHWHEITYKTFLLLKDGCSFFNISFFLLLPTHDPNVFHSNVSRGCPAETSHVNIFFPEKKEIFISLHACMQVDSLPYHLRAVSLIVSLKASFNHSLCSSVF